MSCRYCGGVTTPAQQQQFGGEYCCAAHKASYEEALLRLALGQEPEVSGYILETRPQTPEKMARPYPAQAWKVQTMPELPRLAWSGESLESRVKPLHELVQAAETGSETTPEIAAIEARGIYPYPVFRLEPVGKLEVAATAASPLGEKRKKFWWQEESTRVQVPKGLKPRSRGNPSPDPKGFTGALPMNQIVQPSYKSLRNRSLSGDYAMAETVNRDRARGLAADLAGAPSMQLPGIRQAALRLSEEHWRGFQPPVEAVEALEFLPVLEYLNSTKLWFKATGFNFRGDQEKLPRNGFRPPANEPPLINVRALLNEPDTAPREITKISFEPIVWDELDGPKAEAMPEIPALAAALELYQPPAPKVEARKAEPVAANPEPAVEPDVEPPPMCDLVRFPAPKMRPPAPVEPPSVEPLATSGSRMHMPALAVTPLRPRMFLAPKPEAEAAPAKPTAVVPPKAVTPAAPAVEAKAPESKPPVEAPKPQPTPEAKTETKPEPKVEPKTEPKVEVKTEAKPAETVTPQRSYSNGRRNGRSRNRRDATVDDPIEEPMELSAELEDAIAQGVDDDFEPEPVVQPAAKPAPVVEFKPALLDSAPVPEKQSDTFTLGITQSEERPAYTSNGMGSGAKIGIAAAVLAAIGGVGVWQFGGSSSPKEKPAVTATARASAVETAGSVVGEPGWQQDWVTDAKAQRIRQIAFYRPSTTAVDYRAEFQAEVEYKAVSWVVRAANVKNHCVLKIVQVKGGAQPVFHLVRMAVRDGKPDEPVEKPIPIAVRMGQVFKVQTDVIADKFSVTIQDKIIDEWVDSKLLTGGFGVANEGAERGQIRSIQMWYLKPRSN